MKNLVEDILNVSSIFKKIEFSFIHMKLNEATHKLAKFGFEKGQNFELVRSLPPIG